MTTSSMKISAILALLLVVSLTTAFQPALPATTTRRANSNTAIFYNEHPERTNHRVTKQRQSEPPMECYLVEEDDEVDEDDPEATYLAYQKPRVVCTTDPEEYAWFNGIDRERLVPTDATETGAMECVEGASPRGTPEWECE